MTSFSVSKVENGYLVTSTSAGQQKFYVAENKTTLKQIIETITQEI